MSLLNLYSKVILCEIHLEMGAFYESLSLLNQIECVILGKTEPDLQSQFYIMKAKVGLHLSNEVVYNERGAVAMKKAAIQHLDQALEISSKANLYQQMRESLFIKGLLADFLAQLYKQRDKIEMFHEFTIVSENCAKEFNNIDDFIQTTLNSISLKQVQV